MTYARDRATSPGPPGLPVIDVRNLTIDIAGVRVVDGVSFTVAHGECLAIVGESGAGKSLTANSLLGLTPSGAHLTAELFDVVGVDVRGFNDRQWRNLRGRSVGLVSQDALVSLDPLRRVGAEVAEAMEVHDAPPSRAQRRERVHTLLDDVAIPEPQLRARQYPSELSGGLRQRALIASALAANPPIVVADEPTTALDATVQVRILELLGDIKRSGRAIVLVSHDLGVVSRIADTIAVMKDGVIVETGPAAMVLARPQHPYTKALIASQPRPRANPSEAGAVVLEARGLSKSFARNRSSPTHAVRDVSLEVAASRTLGIVGESGSGKSTLARLLVGLEAPDAGDVLLRGEQFSALSPARKRPLRAHIQLIDQDSYGTFDPRFTVESSLGEALAIGGIPRAERRARMVTALVQVGLDPMLLGRRRHELSGGQRQRIAIARALLRQPSVLVCDESVSALDVSVQAEILALLRRLQIELGLALIVISHDLAVISAVSDEILVMKDGRVVESGPTAVVLEQPRHQFTRELRDSFAATRHGRRRPVK